MSEKSEIKLWDPAICVAVIFSCLGEGYNQRVIEWFIEIYIIVVLLGSMPTLYRFCLIHWRILVIFFIVQSAVGATTVPPGDKSGKFAPKFCLVLKFNCQLRATGGHHFLAYDYSWTLQVGFLKKSEKDRVTKFFRLLECRCRCTLSCCSYYLHEFSKEKIELLVMWL